MSNDNDHASKESLSRASSFEKLDPHDPRLSCLASSMFQKTSEYLNGELTSIEDAYDNLSVMNSKATAKYSKCNNITANAVNVMNSINETCVSLAPYIEQIDEIEKNINKLEKMAHALDEYTKRLQSKFKKHKKLLQ